MYKKILLPTDGSGYADQEIERASNLIAEDGEILVISVAGKLTSSAFQSRKHVKKVNEGMLNEAKGNMQKMVDKFDDDFNVRGIVKTGFPAEVINEVAEEEDVDLIIISASGKSGLKMFFIGSVAEKVLKTAKIDVLLVRNK